MRKTASGKHVTVRQHLRRDLPGHGAFWLLNRRHRDPHPYRGVVRVNRGVGNLKRAGKFLKRNKGAAALLAGTAGLVELMMWLLLRGTGLILTAVVAVLGSLAAVSVSRTMTDATPYGGTHRPTKTTSPVKTPPTKAAPVQKATSPRKTPPRKTPAKKTPAKKTTVVHKPKPGEQADSERVRRLIARKNELEDQAVMLLGMGGLKEDDPRVVNIRMHQASIRRTINSIANARRTGGS
jgi:hypothetical protein